MTGVHVIKKDPEGGTGTLYWRETSVDTALFPLGKIDGPCKQINYAESIANTCHFQFNANLFLTLPLRRLGCMPGSECMFRLLQGRKGALYMLHRGSCPQDYWFPTRGFTELHISVHHSESQVCFFFSLSICLKTYNIQSLETKLLWVCWMGVARLTPLLRIWGSFLVS